MWGIWRSYYNIPTAIIVYLLEVDYTPVSATPLLITAMIIRLLLIAIGFSSTATIPLRIEQDSSPEVVLQDFKTQLNFAENLKP